MRLEKGEGGLQRTDHRVLKTSKLRLWLSSCFKSVVFTSSEVNATVPWMANLCSMYFWWFYGDSIAFDVAGSRPSASQLSLHELHLIHFTGLRCSDEIGFAHLVGLERCEYEGHNSVLNAKYWLR